MDNDTVRMTAAKQDSAEVDDGKTLYYHVTEKGELFSCRAASKEEAERRCFEWLQNKERHG